MLGKPIGILCGTVIALCSPRLTVENRFARRHALQSGTVQGSSAGPSSACPCTAHCRSAEASPGWQFTPSSRSANW